MKDMLFHSRVRTRQSRTHHAPSRCAPVNDRPLPSLAHPHAHELHNAAALSGAVTRNDGFGTQFQPFRATMRSCSADVYQSSMGHLTPVSRQFSQVSASPVISHCLMNVYSCSDPTTEVAL